jgi:hypothetical protein
LAKEEGKKRRNGEEGEKRSLRFPQTLEATTFFPIHINCKRVLYTG